MSSEERELMAELLRRLRDLEPHTSLPVVVSREVAAKQLNISLTTLKRWIRTGEIVPCKSGIPASEVYRLAEPARITAAAPRRKRKKRPEKKDHAALIAALAKKKD